MIPEEANAEFVYAMEQVLQVYQRPYDPSNPVVCMDESPCQLIGETRKPFRDAHGVEHADYEYVRNGVASVFVAFEPLAGRRLIRVRDTHKGEDFVAFMGEVARMHPQADKVTVWTTCPPTRSRPSTTSCPRRTPRLWPTGSSSCTPPSTAAGSTWPR